MRKMANNAPVSPGFGFGMLNNMNMGVVGLGLVGILGAGILGYTLWNRRSKAAPVSTGFTNFSNVAPIVHNRRVPVKERMMSKATGRPVVTNYH